jgi:hypothetical protein
MGGEVFFDSTLNQGSTFGVTCSHLTDQHGKQDNIAVQNRFKLNGKLQISNRSGRIY